MSGSVASIDDEPEGKVGSVTIRLAQDMHDIERMIELGRVAHAESQFSEMEFSPDKLMEFGINALSDKGRERFGPLIAERVGK